uniref:Uncharacterized protein n=1 Tax=uncultured marine crenarchaeote HF4000_APKG8O8 TaxID=455607 RepID=B3TBA9_9ARCH|nr:hypothetical protein ALOHA_HF4000APKG8O8ctg1g21 [uncultured marine crenarchaeote HF4000_APKG8O8]
MFHIRSGAESAKNCFLIGEDCRMNSYIKRLLEQVFESYTILYKLENKSGDVEIIKKEYSRIDGLIKVLYNTLRAMDNSSDDLVELLQASKSYLDGYEFSNMIETIASTYSEDPLRIKNLRLAILDTLEKTNLIFKVESMLGKTNF